MSLGTTPNRSYLICATPRTGSYLLCDGLRATGVAGRPTEFVSPSFQQYWAKQWGTPTYENYLERIVAAGTTPNGVFGIKAHPYQFTHFLRQASGQARLPLGQQASIVERWFPRPAYVWLRRRDRARQAVSYARAAKTHVWWDANEAPAPFGAPVTESPRFDYSLVERSAERLGADDASWRAFFRANHVEPMTVFYEDLVADYPGTIRQVMDHLGLQGGFRELPQPGFRRQADGLNDRWTDRFVRLAQAKQERTLAAFADLHPGATAVVLAGPVPSEVVSRLRQSPADGIITVVVHPVELPFRADYALVMHRDGICRDRIDADVVFTRGAPVPDHPFVVKLPPSGSEADAAVRLAAHMGASRITVLGESGSG